MGLMGLVAVATQKADGLARRDAAVTVVAYAAGAAAAAAAVAITVALLAFGWKEAGWVLVAPAPQGVMSALGMTGLIVLVALPVTFIAGIFAAACVGDPSIGGVTGKALRESFEWSSGVPPVVVGAAVFFSAIALRNQTAAATAILALVLLNLPNAAARLAHAFEIVPRETREAAAALGASPVASFLGLWLPSAAWAVVAVMFTLMGQMIGETSAIALAIGASTGSEPLSVQIWHFAANSSLVTTEAAASIVLVIAVGVSFGLSRFCARRQTGTTVPSS